MSDYSIALFLHVVGALTLFMALALEWVGLRALWRARSLERSREWLGVLVVANRMGRVSMLALIAAGGYMMATAWGRVSWLIVGLGGVAPFPVLAWALVRPRMAAIHRTIARGVLPAESLPAALRVLWLALHLRLGLALGLVFLMTVKPGFATAWTAIAAGGVVGLTASLLRGRGAPSEQGAVDSGSIPERLSSPWPPSPRGA